MKFKTLKGSDTYRGLSELMDKINSANTAALEWAHSKGALSIRLSGWHLGGGIASLVFAGLQDKTIFKKAGKGYEQYEYLPRLNTPAGRLMDSEMRALPTVDTSELFKILNMKFTPFSHPGFSVRDDFALVETSVRGFNPPADLIEIIETEYYKLKGESDGLH